MEDEAEAANFFATTVGRSAGFIEGTVTGPGWLFPFCIRLTPP